MPSIPTRVAALEAAVELANARRLTLLVALHAWLTADPLALTDDDFFQAFKAHLEERIADEEP